ncbi:MAG: DUF3109 family protein [Anaerolineaceae bacterium]|nr:DUF3109 family protein [Anaerolineaceae bacterium]
MFDRVNPRLFCAEPVQRCNLSECRAACCLHGVWIDVKEAQDILRNAGRIQAHMPPGLQDPSQWFDERRDEDEHSLSGVVVHSAVLDAPEHYGGTACVFLRSDAKCALQVAADAAGEHPWRFKPYYCILHPLDIDENGRITLDATDLMLEEPGSCLRPAERPIPLAETFEPELRYLLGEKAYQKVLRRSRKTE